MENKSDVKEIKSTELVKMIFKGHSTGLALCSKAHKEGVLTRTRKGYYLYDDKAKEWIRSITKQSD